MLWDAFRDSGATDAPQPADWDGTMAADAAAFHVGTAGCDLTLLPLEDALALPEQPNLPGTTDEHPNWRRRMPAPAATLLDAPDVAARLDALSRGRDRA
jgi:4-alpha-glucanotransferase